MQIPIPFTELIAAPPFFRCVRLIFKIGSSVAKSIRQAGILLPHALYRRLLKASVFHCYAENTRFIHILSW